MVGFIYRYSAFGVTISVYSHTHDTAPTRALLFDLFSLINFFITPIFYMPAEPASEQSERLQQYAARSAPLKAHTAQRTAHCYAANVAQSQAPKMSRLTSHRLMSIGTNVTQKEPRQNVNYFAAALFQFVYFVIFFSSPRKRRPILSLCFPMTIAAAATAK